jgi:dihydrofolate reductase
MRKVIVAMQMSFDGFVEAEKGGMDWLIYGNEEWKELLSDLKSVDTFLLGRKMYPDYAGHWRALLANPADDPYQNEFAKLINNSPHIVFSRTNFKSDWRNTRVVNNVSEEIEKLKRELGKDMVLWGGAEAVSTLSGLGLVDQYRITLNPTVLGGGKALFNNITERLRLKLIDIRPLKSGNVIIRYNHIK